MKLLFALLTTLPVMAFAVDPMVRETPVLALHPTQASVGLAAVEEKVEWLKKMSKGERRDYLVDHPVPVVIGPQRQYFMIDHHHLSRALADLDVEKTYAKVIADWSDLEVDAFWRKMQERAFVYLDGPADEKIDPAALPATVKGLVDDPYRSLAYFAREHGAFEKTTIPFAEFFWADYYRRFIPEQDIRENPWKKTLKTALIVSRLPEASALPGFNGPPGAISACSKVFAAP